MNSQETRSSNIPEKRNMNFYCSIIRKINVECSCCFFNWCISYMLFPSILLQKVVTLFDSISWDTFIMIFVFTLGDFLGRIVIKYLKQTKFGYPRKFLIGGSALRLILVATTFVIAFNEDSQFWNASGTVVANSFLLGLTNGFMGAASIESFMPLLQNHEKEFAGFMISLLINGGITVGSLISLVCFAPLFN